MARLQILFLSLMILVTASAALNAQSRPDTTFTIDLLGEGVKKQGELYTTRSSDGEWLVAARIVVDGKTVWSIDTTNTSDMYPWNYYVATVKADSKGPRDQILIKGAGDNDWNRYWLIAWDGTTYQTTHLDTWGGEFNWSGDNRFTIDGWIGFCVIRKSYTFDPRHATAAPVEVDHYPIVNQVEVKLKKGLTLTTERAGGKKIAVARKSTITLEAIDMRNLNTEEDPMMGNSWIRVRTSSGKVGWVKLGKLTAAADLPWAG